MAGITFKKIGAPQPEDIIKASSKDVVKSFCNIDTSVLSLFEETAQ
jgi:hypothetical protein